MKGSLKNTCTVLGLIGAVISFLLLTPAMADGSAEISVKPKENDGRLPLSKVSGNQIYYCDIGDASEAISKSDMWSHDKERAMQYLSNPKIEMDFSRYKAVCAATKSDMWSNNMADAIGRICGY